MSSTFEKIRTACADIDERLLGEHLSRLGHDYFRRFSEEEICSHLKAFTQLSNSNPVELLIEMRRDGAVDCTVLAFDYPSEFSIITGILAGTGFSILSGDVFTYRKAAEKASRPMGRKRIRKKTTIRDPLKRRRIIDHFTGVPDIASSFETWAGELKAKMKDIIGLLERGEDISIREAKHRVNEMVVKRLAFLQKDSPPVLYPVKIETDSQTGPYTRLRVISEDTPAFLYSLSNALSLHGISIEHVRIRTIHGRIEDEIDLVDSRGNPLADSDSLNRVKLSALLTKQFTYFLGKAPDPQTALARFEHLLADILKMPEQGEWIDLLANQNTLQDLAQLLGTSDYLWEDFIRLQYESLLPMLRPYVGARRFSGPMASIQKRLNQYIEDASSFDDQIRRLNEFKDREIFLIDLDHILNPESNLETFGRQLSTLAETVVRTTAELSYERLSERFGKPRTIAGLETKFAILGLGKLGAAALGYASDIELLFVYGDDGESDGSEAIGNSEFFDRMVKDVVRSIKTKREGIFRIDLRLRPYGNSGPIATSLENFCRYYGTGGQAHSYERLALVRMRAIGGDPELGAQLERLRDEMIYSSQNIDLQELRELREKQFKEKTKGDRLNAKFSPGAVVDLEYGVEILQVIHGNRLSRLRTPRIHEALNALAHEDILSSEEAERLMDAYDFLRRLINGMRMLRGSAEDLFLPPFESDEFAHLSRRMGYERGGGLDSAQQLRIDFERHTAAVRVFAEQYFGRAALPSPETGTVVDLILSDKIPEDSYIRILSHAQFRNPKRAYTNLKNMAGKGNRRNTFAKIVLLACDILAKKSDPDMALNNWERFIHSVISPEFHYNLLLSQPMRLDILLTLFSGSQFLSDTLIRNPGFLDWLMMPDILHKARRRKDIERELQEAAQGCSTHEEWLNKLRRFRRRGILRIGTRDLFLGLPTRQIMNELSMLAEACTQVALERAFEHLSAGRDDPGKMLDLKGRFCIMAFGKLGGNELNYSSDIDLMAFWAPLDGSSPRPGEDYHLRKAFLEQVMERLISDLSQHTEEGYVYRVDMRLRPYGKAGELVPTIKGLTHYYRESASLWELQAALKLRPVAGNLLLGYDLLERIRPILLMPRRREDIVGSVEKMRKAAMRSSSIELVNTVDIKSGLGGLRDVEFLVQGLQLLHAPGDPGLVEGNTMLALEALQEKNILGKKITDQMKEDYIFLRRTEHYLQILEDRQIHSLPKDSAEMEALAKRMLGHDVTSSHFMTQLEGCLTRIRNAYTGVLLREKKQTGELGETEKGTS